jgi:hypothetical protein
MMASKEIRTDESIEQTKRCNKNLGDSEKHFEQMFNY